MKRLEVERRKDGGRRDEEEKVEVEVGGGGRSVVYGEREGQ